MAEWQITKPDFGPLVLNIIILLKPRLWPNWTLGDLSENEALFWLSKRILIDGNPFKILNCLSKDGDIAKARLYIEDYISRFHNFLDRIPHGGHLGKEVFLQSVEGQLFLIFERWLSGTNISSSILKDIT